MFNLYQRNPRTKTYLYTIDGLNDDIRFAREFNTLATDPDDVCIEAACHFKEMVMPTMANKALTFNLFSLDGNYISRELIYLSSTPTIQKENKSSKRFWNPFGKIKEFL